MRQLKFSIGQKHQMEKSHVIVEVCSCQSLAVLLSKAGAPIISVEHGAQARSVHFVGGETHETRPFHGSVD